MNKYTDNDFNTGDDFENLKKQYDDLMCSNKQKLFSEKEYTEIHHIIPRCLGGDSSETNLIRLSYKDHITAHLLLHKMYPHNFKLLFALKMMLVKSEKSPREELTEEDLALLTEIREKAIEARRGRKMPESFSKTISKANSKRVWSDESKKKDSESHKGVKKTKEHLSKLKLWEKGHIPWNKGKQMSESSRKKLSESRKHLSDEARQHYSESAKLRGYCGETKHVIDPDGVEFKSISECARHYHVAPGTIRERIKRHPELGFKFK